MSNIKVFIKKIMMNYNSNPETINYKLSSFKDSTEFVNAHQNKYNK